MTRRDWTEGGVGAVIAIGRGIARRILGAFAPYLACDLNAKAALFLAADESVQAEAVAVVRGQIIAEGMSAQLAEAHIEGALSLMAAGHPLEDAADLSRRH